MKITTSEILTDDLNLALYATDASMYQLKPIAIAIPSSESDLIKMVKLASTFCIPMLPRGSATSLAGQTTNAAFIIDFTKYFNKILEINPENRYAIVQPGVVRDQLNKEVLKYRLHFAPDPATTSRATIGGMIANNSSGTKSIKYGKTIDHVLELRMLLIDGNILTLRSLPIDEYELICQQGNTEGRIYRQFRELIFRHSGAIEKAFPNVMRRVSGYPLDSFIGNSNWNLASLICGSEGTLGFILDAKVNLEPIPEYKAAFTVHFTDRMQAIRSVKDMVTFSPAAVEMLDYNVFQLSKDSHLTRHLHERLIIGNPDATLSVEFFCLSQNELEEKINNFTHFLKTVEGVYAYPVLRTASELEDSWTLRKNGLGLIMGDPSGRKPMPFIEDMAIPLEYLAEYIESVLKICNAKGVETVLYAHASVGVLHVRPSLDMTNAGDIQIMKEITDEVLLLVKKYGGSWSGEHGDGRNRSPKLKEFFGEEVYECLRQVKKLFDPQLLLNPGIIVDAEPMDHHLRYGPSYKDKKQNFVYKYRKDHSFTTLVHNCSGVGACRNHSGGTMCPSFRATGEEGDSTRGRANALRMAISGQFGFDDITDKKVLEVMDLCLSCKACKSECPSNVDMAKLKSEVLQAKYDVGKITFREKAIQKNADIVPRLSGWIAPFINIIQNTIAFKWVAEKFLGIDRRRTLPYYVSVTLKNWYLKNYTKLSSIDKEVVLFADTYINYHEPHIGISAIQLLQSCGYDVILADVGCCQRPKISNGFLKDARENGKVLAEKLKPYINQGLKIVVCEPSCTTALCDDLPDLIEDENLADALQKSVMAIDHFLYSEVENGNINGRFISPFEDVLMHGHCHQKATFGTEGMKNIYKSISDLKFIEPDSGCCGMAGSFGYEKEHFEISQKISNLVLIPEINKANSQTAIVANGFSCRHQIKDFSGRKAIHWVESVQFVKN
ncbi:MAG: FAD-binding protein [Saprospiraceae bacterium]|nr:FAD-binding protein [Saprospiraceae bacterium]